MKSVQADTLRAAAHLLVGVGEATNDSQAADDVAERMPTHLFFDCWIILDDVGEDGSKADLRQQLRDRHLLAVSIFHLKCVPCVWRHDDVGVVVEGRNQQRPDRIVNFGVPLLVFGKCPENALLAGRQLPTLLDEGFFPCGQGALWHPKHTCTITLAWHKCHLLRQGSTEDEHHLDGIALLVCCFCLRKSMIAISIHQARGLLANKFVGFLHF